MAESWARRLSLCLASVSDHVPSRPCVFCSVVLRVFSLLSHCFGLLTVVGVCVMDWTTWWCVLCAYLPPQSRLILFIFSLDFFPARSVSQRIR